MAPVKIHPATNALGYNIKVLRAMRDLSQDDLAAEARMTTKTISGLENREGNPRLDTLQRLADALRVEVAALFAPPK